MSAQNICWIHFLLACALLLGTNSPSWGQVITTVAGGGTGDGGPATQASLFRPEGVSLDGAGNLYIADRVNQYIRRVDAETGIITIVAGTGDRDFSGDGGLATGASLSGPAGVFVDGAGNLYIADAGNHRIRRVDGTSGIITTVAGIGSWSYSGDGGPASQAGLADPSGVSLDGAGNLYIVDRGNHRIRRVDGATGTISTVVGRDSDGFSGDGGPATQAHLARPCDVAVDGAGNLYIVDVWNNRIRRVDAETGIITTVAGTGEYGFSGDGEPALQATFGGLRGASVDGAGNLYIADAWNQRIRRVDAETGIITTVAGTSGKGFSGDGEPASQAILADPSGVSVDGAGNLYIVDISNHRIRRVDAETGIITTVAGGGVGDGGPATRASLRRPGEIYVEGGHLYIADRGNNRVRRVDTGTGIITTVAGTGNEGFSGDGRPATETCLDGPGAVFVDQAGHLYIADTGNQRIRRVDGATGIIASVAGAGRDGFSGDGGPATRASLNYPGGIFVDGAGNLYIVDTFNSCIRRVDGVTGTITTVVGKPNRGFVDFFSPQSACHLEVAKRLMATVAGQDAEGFSDHGGPATQAYLARPSGVSIDAAGGPDFLGDGGPATQAHLGPFGMSVDGAGNLYIVDTFNNRIRRVDAETGIITTVAGTGEEGFSGDEGPAIEAVLSYPGGVYVDGSGHLYIADTNNHRIRRVDAETGIITTVVGTGEEGFSGDGGLATQAGLDGPGGVYVDGVDHLYIVDTGNDRIRKVILSSTAVAEPMRPDQIPNTLALAQNYPNPFNPHTRIDYQLAQAGPVLLTIYNLLGQRIRRLVQQPQAAGVYQVLWDGTDATGQAVAAGLYTYRLASGQGVLVRRMVRLQ